MTSIDYVVIALSPALIMALVGSLCFFLLEIGYQGEFGGRLNWILFCFVFAIVLIARISIEEGKEKALFYGLALSGAVALAVLKFVPSPFIAWGLIAVVWWCANKLTWDCTVIDDEQDASGEGLLQVAGLDRGEASKAADPNEADVPANDAEEGTDRKRRKQVAWWQQWFGAVEADANQKKPHAPGVWVVYFSLAALPLFGLGQSMVPASDMARRRYVFLLLLCYVAAGLGLLLTTSFLGLRRYLRQRKMEMPLPMTGVWLGVGAVLIVALLVASVILPRPSVGYPVEELIANVVGSPKRQASDYAVLTDGHGEGQGRPSSDAASQAPGQQSGNRQSGNQQSGNQQSGGQQGSGQQSGGQQSGRQRSDGQKDAGQKNGGKESGGEQGGGQPGGGQQGSSPQGGNQQGGNQQGGSQQAGGQQSGDQQSGGQQSGGQQSGGQQSGGQQSGGQQSGGQQSGGQQSGGQQSGGQQSGGQQGDRQKNGGQENGGKQSGGQQDGNQQGGSQQGGSEQGGSQQGGKQQGGNQSGGQQGGDQKAKNPASSGEPNDPNKDSNRTEHPSPSGAASQPAGQGVQPGKEAKPPQSGSPGGKTPSSSASAPPQPPKPQSSFPKLPKFNWSLASWIRWLMYGVMLAAAIFGFIRYREQVLAFLRQMLEELKSIWNDLFGRKHPAEASAGAEEPRPIPRPFAAFADPFANGAAARSTPDQLVRYTFAALEAWAFERGAARRPEATPHEFAQQLGNRSAELAADVQSLANLYAQITYARGSLSPECLPTLKRLWRRLRVPESAVV